MFLRYKSIHEVPRVELRMEPLVREVGPERFWNAHNPVLTHIFNTLNVLDGHCVDFLVLALERVCGNEPDLPEELVAHIGIYIDHLRKGQRSMAEHVELMRQLGHEAVIPDACRLDRAYSLEKMSSAQLVALVNVYSWMTFCVSRFLLSTSWYLAATAAKPAVVLRWRWLIEEIHKGLLPALLAQLGAPAAVHRKAWWSVNWSCNRLFVHLFYQLLKADGCLALRQLPGTLRLIYRVFLHPLRGFYRSSLHFMRLHSRSAGDSTAIKSEKRMDDMLLNAQLYIAQLNPEVDNRAFFSGRFFRDKRDASA